MDIQADGAIIVKANNAILVSEYIAPIQAPEAATVTEAIADYLIDPTSANKR